MNDYKFGEYIFKLTDDENYKNASLAKDAFPYDTQGFIVLHNLTKESFIWNPQTKLAVTAHLILQN